ncbi:hypothetical protein [Ascidiimonas sp. W6]|uniref:arsenate reductase family protein n=1 Tax=Ascidiimonas meishanensis TaxID=3128903 RepID=UPI0030EBD7DC
MSLLATSNNLITLIYNSSSSLGKQTLAYVKASTKSMRFIDVFKENITGTQWLEIAEKLNMSIGDLVDKEHGDFKKENVSNQLNLETNDWLKILDKQPQLLQYSILIKGEEFILINTPSEVANHISPDSGGIDIP